MTDTICNLFEHLVITKKSEEITKQEAEQVWASNNLPANQRRDKP